MSGSLLHLRHCVRAAAGLPRGMQPVGQSPVKRSRPQSRCLASQPTHLHQVRIEQRGAERTYVGGSAFLQLLASYPPAGEHLRLHIEGIHILRACETSMDARGRLRYGEGSADRWSGRDARVWISCTRQTHDATYVQLWRVQPTSSLDSSATTGATVMPCSQVRQPVGRRVRLDAEQPRLPAQPKTAFSRAASHPYPSLFPRSPTQPAEVPFYKREMSMYTRKRVTTAAHLEGRHLHSKFGCVICLP